MVTYLHLVQWNCTSKIFFSWEPASGAPCTRAKSQTPLPLVLHFAWFEYPSPALLRLESRHANGYGCGYPCTRGVYMSCTLIWIKLDQYDIQIVQVYNVYFTSARLVLPCTVLFDGRGGYYSEHLWSTAKTPLNIFSVMMICGCVDARKCLSNLLQGASKGTV